LAFKIILLAKTLQLCVLITYHILSYLKPS